jgi:hypothetical protein
MDNECIHAVIIIVVSENNDRAPLAVAYMTLESALSFYTLRQTDERIQLNHNAPQTDKTDRQIGRQADRHRHRFMETVNQRVDRRTELIGFDRWETDIP